jgi:hypothetical protein
VCKRGTPVRNLLARRPAGPVRAGAGPNPAAGGRAPRYIAVRPGAPTTVDDADPVTIALRLILNYTIKLFAAIRDRAPRYIACTHRFP